MEINISEVSDSGIRRSNAASSEVPVSDIIEDTAAAIKTNSNSIKGVTSNATPYINNNLIISNRVSNRYIAGSTTILYIITTTISKTKGTRHGTTAI
jgi:hypothetical protein